MRQLFYQKMRQKFVTKCDRFFITKCGRHYKMRRLLQIATVHSFTYSFKFTYKCFVRFPAHICWSWRRLQYVFIVTTFGLPRRLGGQKIATLKMSSKCLQDMSLRRLQDISSRCPDHMSSRQLQDVLETKKLGYLYLTNLNGYASNKSLFHKSISDESKANPKSLIRTHWFQYSSYFGIEAAFLFWE